MNYNWEWSNKMLGEICSVVDSYGYRYMLYAAPTGNYRVIKFLVKNSMNLSFLAARPHQIASGWCETTELAKGHAIAAFEKFLNPVTPELKAPQPVQDEVKGKETKPEAIVSEVEFEIQSEPAADGQVKVWLTGLKENAKYKYTTNGKAVITNSKNYKEPFFVAPGTVINAREAIADETGVEQYNNISKTV